MGGQRDYCTRGVKAEEKDSTKPRHPQSRKQGEDEVVERRISRGICMNPKLSEKF